MRRSSSSPARHFTEQLERLEGVLVCYGRAVIHDAWPAMQEGESSTLVNDWGTRFRQQALQTEADTFVQRASFRQLLTEQDQRIEGRRTRLAEAVRTVPEPMWLVLPAGSLLTIGWVILSLSSRGTFLVQAAVVASVTAMVASVLFLVWFLDHRSQMRAEASRRSRWSTLHTIAEEAEGQHVEVAHRAPRGRSASE